MSRQYSILCLNGGGFRGGIQIGALLEFAKTVGTSNFASVFTDGMYGVSIGAILVAGLAFGCTIDEIADFARTHFSFHSILDHPNLGSLVHFRDTLGFDNGEKVHACLKQIFQSKGLDLDTLTIGDASVPLNIVATDLSRTKLVLFGSHVGLWDAIRASISLPFVFTPHTIRGRVFVDGSVLCKQTLKLVKPEHRTKAIGFFLVDNRPLTEVTPSEFVSAVMRCHATTDVLRIKSKYPQNVVLLHESTVGMLDPEPDVEYMLTKGAELYRLFLSESRL